MRHPNSAPIIGFLLLFLLCLAVNAQSVPKACPNGRKPLSQVELDDAVDKNEAWCDTRRLYKDGERANFSCADMHGVDLEGRTLCGADFSDADLRGAILKDADLSGTRLAGADLSCLPSEKAPKDSRCPGGIRTNLADAILRRADATGANFENAKLSGATLRTFTTPEYAKLIQKGLPEGWTQLNDVKMRNADLTGADMIDVDFSGNSDLREVDLSSAMLKDADVSGVDLQDAIFQPNLLPNVSDIARAKNLEYMKYEDSPNALAQLRKLFEDGGFRDQARKITFALSDMETQKASFLEKGFRTIAFKWTCAYGMRPERTLELWSGLLLILWITYAVFIHAPGKSGIYIVRHVGNGEPVEEQIVPGPSTKPLRLWQFVYSEARIFFWAGFFCLMSAFNVGFKDIDFGRWLRLLPRTEYDLKAKGWARSVAGVQALLSIYLLALWVLTYFGHPFDY